MEEPVYLYIIGTAGSGKSTLTAAIKRWMYEHGHDALLVNLDPGAEKLPYEPDVDIRDWIVLNEVMERYSLGPNGAQILAADLLALQAGDVKAAIDSYRPDYVLLDTPGQTELFIFREAGKLVMDFLGPADRTAILFVADPFLAKSPSAFVSQIMLSATTQFRFQVPQVNVLSKTDLLKDEQRDRLREWSETPDVLENELYGERATLYNQLNADLFKILASMGTYTTLIPVSSESLEGIEDIYSRIQDLFAGGEDLDKR